jgi:catechol 2,3-dioxygenase-like lactoylglutathione lyase family enzyme
MKLAPPFVIERIDHVLLLVDGMDRALEFYEGTLGCIVEHRIDRFAMAELQAGSSHIDLVDTGAPEGRWAMPKAGGGRNVDHVCLSVGRCDKEAVRVHLTARGAEIAEERSDEYDGRTTHSFYVRDPSGNTIELLMFV